MAGRSSCPQCGTILRIRDRSFVGRRVNCPECKTSLRIEATDRDDEFITRRIAPVDRPSAEVESAGAAPTGPLSAKSSSRRSNVNQTGVAVMAPTKGAAVQRLLHSPLTVAWLLAIAVVSCVAVLALGPRFRFSAARPIVSRPVSLPPVEPVRTPDPVVEPPEDTSVPPEPQISVSAIIDDSDSLSALEPVNVEGPLPWPPVAVTSQPTEPPPPKIDVAAKLAQELTSYKQPKVSRRFLLEALQEQLGAQIRYDAEELGAADLDGNVSFELENTTIGEVIQTVVDAAGWQMEIEPTGLRLTRKK